MKRYEVGQLRNVVLLGGSRAGKTSLAEALLFTTGATSRLGSVDEGTSVLDFDPDEVARKLTLNTTLASLETRAGQDQSPRHPRVSRSFSATATAACRVADAALFVVSAATGIKFETETLWKAADENGLPRMIVVTKLDRERTSVAKVLEDAERVPRRAADPDPGADRRRGLLPRRRRPAARARRASSRATASGQETIGEIPAELADEVEAARERLAEGVAESDDALLEKYLDGQPIAEEEVRDGLRAGVLAGQDRAAGLRGPDEEPGHGGDRRADLLAAALAGGAPGRSSGKNPAGGRRSRAPPRRTRRSRRWSSRPSSTPTPGRSRSSASSPGTLAGDQLFNATRGVRERAGSLNQVLGKTLKSVPEVGPGDFAAVVKLKETHTGDTLLRREAPAWCFPPIVFPNAGHLDGGRAEEQGRRGQALDGAAPGDRGRHDDPRSRATRRPRRCSSRRWASSTSTIVVERMKRLGVDVVLKEPKVPYRETVSKSFRTMYRHKKQTGGAGPVRRGAPAGRPARRAAPASSTTGRSSAARSPPPSSPRSRRGSARCWSTGVIAGYPVVDVKAAVTDGKEHPVDSKDIAFQMAGPRGLQARRAGGRARSCSSRSWRSRS